MHLVVVCSFQYIELQCAASLDMPGRPCPSCGSGGTRNWKTEIPRRELSRVMKALFYPENHAADRYQEDAITELTLIYPDLAKSSAAGNVVNHTTLGIVDKDSC